MPSAHPYHFHVLDVFTRERYAGNPLAVVLGADALGGGAMQRVAREFNLSETIFVCAPENADHEARVRIFTPAYEMAFAGHPIVGCAIHLAERRWPKGALDETIVLEANAGPVPVRVQRHEGLIQATFTAPIVPAPTGEALDREAVAAALDLRIDDLRDDHPCHMHHGGPAFAYVPLQSLDALARARPLEPHFAAAFGPDETVGAYCYAPDPDGEGTAFRARMFAPHGGVSEDPATGSASAILASQLLMGGALQDGTNAVALRQGIEMGRPSAIALEADVEEGMLQAVRVSGSAVRVSDGQILA